MNQNIKINYVRGLDSKLYTGKYYDFMLFKGEVGNQTLDDINNLAIADFSTLHIVSGILYSTVLWSGATNSGVDMVDIGFTGMDNGLIHFDKDRITNEQFLELYLNSEYKIESGDTRLFLTPVTGNTQMYTYPMYLVNDESGNTYIACKGGFYQGFFKLDGFDYQVLPNKVEKEWMMHFEIRPRSDYEVDTKNVNYIHPENDGIFFFMGTRAENKFWPFYKTDSAITESMKKSDAQSEGYFSGCNEESGETYNIKENNIIFEKEWLKDEPKIEEPKEEGYFIVGDGYYAFDGETDITKGYSSTTKTIISNHQDIKLTDNFLDIYGFNEFSNCHCTDCEEEIIESASTECNACCEEYFKDDYYNQRCAEDNGKAIESDYISSAYTEINLNGYDDSEGHSVSGRGYYEIETDNKFLMFDRTKYGVTTHTYEEGMSVVLTGKKPLTNVNYFLLFDRTPTGYTVHTIDQYLSENEEDYNIYKDIRGNVFALRVTENGAIGYRYGVLDCDSGNTNNYKIEEEYSKDGLVKPDEWNSINVRFCVLNPASNKCDTRRRLMRISIYVNGFLVFISKELDAFMFKPLDEVSQKQEAVPYNISLGGGSIGLLETILPNYYAIPEYILPIEKDFCGTFFGDIKSFKMYNGFINYSAIKNYLS